MARDIIDDRLIGALHLQGLRQSGFAHLAAEPHGAGAESTGRRHLAIFVK